VTHPPTVAVLSVEDRLTPYGPALLFAVTVPDLSITGSSVPASRLVR
jgi:hypothetical protein